MCKQSTLKNDNNSTLSHLFFSAHHLNVSQASDLLQIIKIGGGKDMCIIVHHWHISKDFQRAKERFLLGFTSLLMPMLSSDPPWIHHGPGTAGRPKPEDKSSAGRLLFSQPDAFD